MDLATLHSDLDVRLRPHGVGRFLGAGFLAVWLAGWAVGEVVVAGLLIAGIVKLLSGEFHEPAAAIALGAFLVVWLAFWTIGGIAAMRELLRAVWAEDVVVAVPPGLRVLHRLGPFRSTVELRRDEIVRVRVLPGNRALVAETANRTVELSALGSVADREDAARRLTAMLGIAPSAEDRAPASLPDGWTEIVDPEGRLALVRDPVIRRKQAMVATVAAMVAGLAALLLVREAAANTNLTVTAALAVAAAAGLAWGAVRLARGRTEWRIEHRRLVLRRRFGSRARDVFEAAGLELSVSRDGDGDEWYRLDAVAPGAPQAPLPGRRDNARRRIAQAIHDPDEPVRIGRWLAARAEVPLRDRTTPEARGAETGAAGWL